MCYINSGVFNSGKFKNDLYLHFRVSPTPARAPPGEGSRGGFNPILSKIMCYINSGVFIRRVFKNDLDFYFGVPPTPARAPHPHPWGGGAGSLEGGWSHTPPKIMFYINFRVFNSGEFKIIFISILGVPHPPQGRPRGGRGRGSRGG